MSAQRCTSQEPIVTTLRDFIAQRREVANVHEHAGDGRSPPLPGHVYAGGLWLARLQDGRFTTKIEGDVHESRDVRVLEARLFQYGLDVGLLAVPPGAGEPAFFGVAKRIFSDAGLRLIEPDGEQRAYGWHDPALGIRRYGFQSVIEAHLSALEFHYGAEWDAATDAQAKHGFLAFAQVRLDASDLRAVESKRP